MSCGPGTPVETTAGRVERFKEPDVSVLGHRCRRRIEVAARSRIPKSLAR
jgi:hypothetical protein